MTADEYADVLIVNYQPIEKIIVDYNNAKNLEILNYNLKTELIVLDNYGTMYAKRDFKSITLGTLHKGKYQTCPESPLYDCEKYGKMNLW